MRLFLSFSLFLFMGTSSMYGTTVLITGANRGIGLEFAKQFKQMGYDVIGTSRRPGEADELKKLGISVQTLDVADKGSIENFAKNLSNTPIDILINNAGVFLDRSDTLKTLNPEMVAKTFAVNTSGPIFVTQALLPNLKKGKLKQIINISSQLGSIENSTGGMYAYRTSKSALNQFSKTASQDLEKEGFTVISLHPGWVQTDMGGKHANYTPEASVRKMIQVIVNLKPSQNGHFLDLNGQDLPW